MENQTSRDTELKLFMILLGSKAPGRHVEQHDYFFGIAPHLKDLVPEIKAFWSDAGEKIHIDAWREVNTVDGFKVTIQTNSGRPAGEQNSRLFFINLGGYQRNKFEEQHYPILTVRDSMAEASRTAKDTFFFKEHHFEGATSHIDDKYGVDVDDLYQIEDILAPGQKAQYRIVLQPAEGLKEDEIHLGYLKLGSLDKL